MRLEDLRVETMHEAVDLYLEAAFEPGSGRKEPPIAWAECKTVEDALAFFKNDTGSHMMRKYSLRLGNSRYPYMKMVFQELLIRDSFFFAVDTHDELDIKKSYPDFEKWLEIKQYNADVKERIEKSWAREGIPTFASVVAEVEAQTPERRTATGPQPLILVVDDEADIARGVETILNRSGFQTRSAASAEAALEMLEDLSPDLIISDLEMSGMTGLDLARKLRENPETAGVPFILATAATVGSSNFRVIDGYLVKPFDSKVLIKFVEQHLRPDEDTP